MNTYTYSREIFTGLTGSDAQYNNWAYNINNPMHIDNDGAPISLFQDVTGSALNINPFNLKVVCDNNSCNIFIDGDPLTEEQEIILDNIVQVHKDYRSQS
jgi:hypothetical protein